MVNRFTALTRFGSNCPSKVKAFLCHCETMMYLIQITFSIHDPFNIDRVGIHMNLQDGIINLQHPFETWRQF
jgi:hypothetical protein